MLPAVQRKGKAQMFVEGSDLLILCPLIRIQVAPDKKASDQPMHGAAISALLPYLHAEAETKFYILLTAFYGNLRGQVNDGIDHIVHVDGKQHLGHDIGSKPVPAGENPIGHADAAPVDKAENLSLW